MLRAAAKGKGNFGLGPASQEQAVAAGRAWVGDNATLASDGKTWVSQDLLRQSVLAHKVLAVAEEEGAGRASYALKLLQSDGELSIASTGKDPATGRLVTNVYTVTGPAAIFLTTTATDVDEELLNRCLVLAVDEGREQTRAIHDRQRAAQTLDGLLAGADAEAAGNCTRTPSG